MKKNKITQEKNELAQNVKVLSCGRYGYILNGKAIFKSNNLKKVNDFSNYCNSAFIEMSSNKIGAIKKEAERRQKIEGDFFVKNELPSTSLDRVTKRSNYFESVVQEKI